MEETVSGYRIIKKQFSLTIEACTLAPGDRGPVSVGSSGTLFPDCATLDSTELIIPADKQEYSDLLNIAYSIPDSREFVFYNYTNKTAETITIPQAFNIYVVVRYHFERTADGSEPYDEYNAVYRATRDYKKGGLVQLNGRYYRALNDISYGNPIVALPDGVTEEDLNNGTVVYQGGFAPNAVLDVPVDDSTLTGTISIPDGDLTGELGGVTIGGGEKPFIIPITESTGGSGVVYSTTVMFADIVDAYKTGKRILIRSRGFGGEADVEIVSAVPTEVSHTSISTGEETSEISKILMVAELSPSRSYPKQEKILGIETYEFSYGANGAAITKDWMTLPSYDVFNSSRSHVGMIIQSTTLDTMQKVIDVYGGTEWQQLEGEHYTWERTA